MVRTEQDRFHQRGRGRFVVCRREAEVIQAELYPYFGILRVEHLGLFNRNETLLGFAPSPKGRGGLKPQV
jgi:hypothetical protein